MQHLALPLFIILPFALAAGPARADEGIPPAAVWATQCVSDARSAAAACSMEQRLTLQETGQLFATLTVSVPAERGAPNLTVTTPLGIFLPAGVALLADSVALPTLAVGSCDNSGCYAGAALSDDSIEALRNSTTLSVTMQNLDRQTISFDVPLADFSAAFERIRWP